MVLFLKIKGVPAWGIVSETQKAGNEISENESLLFFNGSYDTSKSDKFTFDMINN